MQKWTLWFLFVAALAIVPGNLAAVGAAPGDAQLVALMRGTLAAAPAHFVALRSQTPTAYAGELDYKPSASFAKLCSPCAIAVVADEFATAAHDERWVAEFKWNVAKTWTQKRVSAYIRSTFAPLVPGTSFSQGNDADDGSSWFEWDKGKTQFLYVETFVDSKGQRGFLVRVGDTLATNIHVVRLSRGLTSVDRAALSKAVSDLVTIALANVDTDFLSLRGKPFTDTLKGDTDDYFDADVTFGDLLEKCTVDSILFPASDTADSSHWVFGCTTKTVGGPKADVAAVVHDAVVAALSPGFTQTTDPRYLTLLDYRWDRSSDRAMVSIGSSEDDTGTYFLLNVHHYISNQ